MIRTQRNITLNARRKQTGVALFISLVLLLILTIIGVSSVQTTSLEMRMSRNDHDTLLAFQAAESALRDAEADLEAVASTAVFDDTNGKWDVADLGEEDNWRTPGIWTGTNSLEAANAVDGTAAPARYIIEHLGAVVRQENAHLITNVGDSTAGDRVEVFRITARGIGGTVNAQVLLQTTYGRIVN